MYIILLFYALLFWAATPTYGTQIIGWVEQAKISTEGIEIQAKIDSGADNSSLHFVSKEYFEKNGERWVQIKISDDKNTTYELNRKLVRTVKIKRHDGKNQLRDVIELDICIGSTRKKVEVNLVDRTGLQFKMLIGRSFLKNSFLIDSANKNLTRPDCPEK